MTSTIHSLLAAADMSYACPWCRPEVTANPGPDGVFIINVHHDPECPKIIGHHPNGTRP